MAKFLLGVGLQCPNYESPKALAFWDIPVYTEHTIIKVNRVDARFVDKKTREEWAVKMSCQWIDSS